VYIIAPLTAGGVYASYADVRPVLTALAEILPSELRGQDQTRDAAWSRWAVRHDGEIRSRLDRGDEDTLVNWLLLGTSFTSRPRALLDSFPTDGAQLVHLVAARTQDLIAALQSPGTDERRLFASHLLQQQGYRFETGGDRERVNQHLLAEVSRVAREWTSYSREVAEAHQLGDVSEEFAARSRLFRARGLSLDTSMLPNVALEQSLRDLQARGLMALGSIREVVVIGPGLDFSDKSSGYDFYPQQTLQPYGLIDSLTRLGLADRTGAVRVTTLDLSPRVNDHLSRMRQRASRGLPYVIRLPIDLGVPWRREVVAYWNSAGDRIGAAVQAPNQPSIGNGLSVRTVSIPARVALQIQPEDVNIVVQRLTDRRFDLIVATNVFVYYDLLDQALAFSNVEAMLRPGGFLLSNNSVIELHSSRLRSVGYLTVQYSDRPDDGDHIVWYRRLAD
jgi:hypothetical protein